MNYILNIHTTDAEAIVNISMGDRLLGTLSNVEQQEHASFLHLAVKKLLQENGIAMGDLKAIGVTGGPGSYTGIRVGLATAKGLCFALKIPMMMFNALELMAFSAIENIPEAGVDSLFCPMIDARRMEVFTAVYARDLTEIHPPGALILDETGFGEIAEHKEFYYFGTGAEKFRKLVNLRPNKFLFISSAISSESLAKYSWNKFKTKDFENIINASPFYLKEFYSTAKNG